MYVQLMKALFHRQVVICVIVYKIVGVRFSFVEESD